MIKKGVALNWSNQRLGVVTLHVNVNQQSKQHHKFPVTSLTFLSPFLHLVKLFDFNWYLQIQFYSNIVKIITEGMENVLDEFTELRIKFKRFFLETYMLDLLLSPKPT